MNDGMTFEELGHSIWNVVRKLDGICLEVLRYYSAGKNDKACGVMRDSLHDSLHYTDDFIEGAYHCLCGLGYLEPYIDREGVECARLTDKGREVLQ